MSAETRSTQNQSDESSKGVSKGAKTRTSAVESLFAAKEGSPNVFVCKILVEGKDGIKRPCDKECRCQVSNGAPGRVGHLKRWHASQITDLPPPKVSTKGEKRARETEAKHGITKEDLLDFVARNSLPFSILDDEFLLTFSTGLTRNNVAEKMEARAADKYKHELQEMGLHKGAATIAADTGTNQRTRTLDICVTTDCKSIPVAACRARSFTADQIASLPLQRCRPHC